MPRRAKAPRLYLRERPGRGRYWVILDKGREFGTDCREDDTQGAETALSDYIAQKYEPPKHSAALSQVLIADVVNVYLREHAPKTLSLDWICHTAAPIIDWWGDKPLSSIRRTTCDEYVIWRTAQGVSDQTARHDLKTMRAAIRYYHAEYGPLPSVPVVSLPPRKAPKQDYWLTRKEVARRVRLARQSPQTRHVARLILIGVYTGTRPGAILRLKWLPSVDGGWFDLASETLHRRGSGQLESRKRQPPARIHRRLLPHLKRWKRLDEAKGIHSVIHYNGKPVQKLRRSWHSVGGGGDGPHICRHTAATWLMQAGVEQYEAAGYLGMSPETLWEVYGHHSPMFQERASSASRKRP